MIRLLLLDGLREVPVDAPVLRADDLGVVRGEAVFETLRVVGSRPCYLDEHLERFGRSAASLDIPMPPGFDELAAKAAAGIEDAGLRLTLTKGGLGMAVVFEIAAETVGGRSGIRVVTLPLGLASDFRRTAPWLLGGAKSTSYAVNMASSREAHRRGADDAIWTSTDGYVLEAPTSTVVAHLDGRWVTPPAETGILAGTTLRACASLVEIATLPLTVDDLAAAAEVVLLSSVRGVAPVTDLDGRKLVTPAGRALQSAFEASLRR
ncbi:MAG: aminotransferase class [Frankiales bacterium]|nr:aminotransferase class [Frankiales bacterium]